MKRNPPVHIVILYILIFYFFLSILPGCGSEEPYNDIPFTTCTGDSTKIGNNCYSVSPPGENLTWQKAEDYCVSEKGHLPSIHSVEDASNLLDLIPNTRQWLGAKYAGPGFYVWTDGSDLLVPETEDASTVCLTLTDGVIDPWLCVAPTDVTVKFICVK